MKEGIGLARCFAASPCLLQALMLMNRALLAYRIFAELWASRCEGEKGRTEKACRFLSLV